MALDERIITEAIVSTYFDKLRSSLSLDVALVGGGPSGLTAARKLAEAGLNVGLFERKLSVGGGMWGGGMTYTSIVVQEESKHLLDEIGIPLTPYGTGYYVADSVLATTVLAAKACLAGAKIFNCMSVEDVILKEVDGVKRVTGIVIQSSPVEMAGLHVDPLTLNTKCLIECTGHDVEVLKTLTRKNDVKLNTPSGNIEGEQSLWADVAEKDTPENTREVFPGVYVAGMAANATFGSYRMGPVFGGMLLSGEKVAKEIIAKLKG
jgi:thiamine thiazole synthase